MRRPPPQRPAAARSPVNVLKLPTASLVKHRSFSTNSNFKVSEQIKAELNKSPGQKLNNFQLSAVITMSEHGLNCDQLRGKDWFDSTEHVATLEYLAQKSDFKPVEALKTLSQLNHLEVYGIRHGLNSGDVLGLNRMQIRAVLELRKFGIKASHLRDLGWFNSRLHVDALAFLLIEQGVHKVSIKNTLNTLESIAGDKLKLIKTGFGLSGMKGITDQHVQAIHSLNVHFGLTAVELCNEDWFSGPHLFTALHDLTFKHGFEIKDAIDALSKLGKVQHKRLEKETVNEVMDLELPVVEMLLPR